MDTNWFVLGTSPIHMAQHCLQTRALTRCTHCHSSTPCAPLAVHADEIKPRRPPAREHSGRSDIKYIRKKACARALHVNRLLLFLSCTSVRTVRRHAGLGYLLSAPPPCLIRVSVSVAHHREPHTVASIIRFVYSIFRVCAYVGCRLVARFVGLRALLCVFLLIETEIRKHYKKCNHVSAAAALISKVHLFLLLLAPLHFILHFQKYYYVTRQ